MFLCLGHLAELFFTKKNNPIKHYKQLQDVKFFEEYKGTEIGLEINGGSHLLCCINLIQGQ